MTSQKVLYDGNSLSVSIGGWIVRIVACIIISAGAPHVGFPDIGYWRILLVACFFPSSVAAGAAGFLILSRFAGWHV